MILCNLFFFIVVGFVNGCFYYGSLDRKHTLCGCKTTNAFKEKGKLATCGKGVNYRELFLKYELLSNVIAIDLSNNGITELSTEVFPLNIKSKLENIVKLNLGDNKINYIGPGTFQAFENLKWLNLSYNVIGRINKEMFAGLDQLQVLYLNDNTFPIIPGDAFIHLTSLKRLYLNSLYLVCNCLMKNFTAWYRSNRKNKIKLNGLCNFPMEKRGVALKKLKVNSLNCDTPSKLPFFEIQPSSNQVVFEGDTLPLHCEGTDLLRSQVMWRLNGKHINSRTEVFDENIVSFPNKTTISSHIQLQVLPKWSGSWNCTVNSSISHHNSHIEIIVLTNATVYCDRNRVYNEYGEFEWPEAVSGATVRRDCLQPKSINTVVSQAERSCLGNGQWSAGDYSACHYADEVARFAYSKLADNFTQENAIEICTNAATSLIGMKIQENIGLVLVGELILKCQSFNKGLATVRMGSILIQISSWAMTSPPSLLMTSQLSDDTCQDIYDVTVQSTKGLLYNNTSSNQASQNIAVAGYKVDDTINTIHCNVSSSTSTTKLDCQTTPVPFFTSLTQPCISIPASVVKQFHHQDIHMIVYRNGSLFQSSRSHTMSLPQYRELVAKQNKEEPSDPPDALSDFLPDSTGSPLEAVDSSSEFVLVSSIYSVTSPTKQNISEPIVLIFQADERVFTNWNKRYYIGSWDGSRWRKNEEECSFVKMTIELNNRNMSIIKCSVFGVFTLLKNLDDMKPGDVGKLIIQSMHPIVYIGSSLLSLSLLIVILTYLVFTTLLISREAWHMLVNTCLHLLLGVLAFTIGIWRVDHKVLCYSTGITLHYTSLSVLFWIVFSARNISKEMLITQQPPSVEPKPQKPMLRFYMIGCGIPGIICGITAAAKIENYIGDDGKYCWLSWETSSYAFYAPAALIAIGCLLVLLRIVATLGCNSAHVDLQKQKLLNRSKSIDAANESTPLRCTGASIKGSPSNDHSAAISALKEIENEQTFRTRLRGVSLTLALYIATWVFAALTVAAPSNQTPSPLPPTFQEHEEESSNDGVDLQVVFMYLFTFFASALAVFITFQHFVSRRDVITRWKSVFACKKQLLTSSDGDFPRSDIGIITNIKTTKDNKPDNTATASVTEETTLETLVPATTGGDTSTNPASLRNISDSHIVESTNQRPITVGAVLEEESGSHHVISESINRNNLHSSQSNSYFAQMSRSSSRIQTDSHLLRRPINQCSKHHHRYGNHHHKHHHNRDGSRPIKMTNLRPQLDTSITDHSFDESQVNMHTIPVVLQHNQPKIHNSMMYNSSRYQRIRKNLEARRNRQRKLTVLREYAQDPLTSNDEGKEKKENAPLLNFINRDQYLEEEAINENLAINEYKKADMMEKLNSGQQSGELKYRLLLVSSPNRKKEDARKENPHHSSGNPNLIANYSLRKHSQTDKSEPGLGNPTKSSSGPQMSYRGRNETASSQSRLLADKNDANMSLHGIEEKNEKRQLALESQKSHNYLTANSILSSPFHVPTRKSPSSGPNTSGVHLVNSPLMFKPTVPAMQQDDEDGRSSAEESKYSSLKNETAV